MELNILTKISVRNLNDSYGSSISIKLYVRNLMWPFLITLYEGLIIIRLHEIFTVPWGATFSTLKNTAPDRY